MMLMAMRICARGWMGESVVTDAIPTDGLCIPQRALLPHHNDTCKWPLSAVVLWS